AVQGAERVRAARHRRDESGIETDSRPSVGIHVLSGRQRRVAGIPRRPRADAPRGIRADAEDARLVSERAQLHWTAAGGGTAAAVLIRGRTWRGCRKGGRAMSDPLKHRSAAMTDGPSRAPARSYFKAIGFTDEDLRKPLVGIANTWTEIGPCNFHLRRLAQEIKQGVREAGGTPMEFNTIAVSDGITMGTEGMRTSLVSREVIADSIELVAGGHSLDAVVMICGCDKTIPGTIMALARLNVPGVVLYGGSIAPGKFEGHDVTIQDVFEAVGAHAAGKMSDARLLDLENHACPGAGACGGQFTANTMAMACEFLGVSPFGSASVPAMLHEKDAVARQIGKLAMDALRRNQRPRDILTRAAFENAIAGVVASGGSTNAVLHLLAIAREAGVALELEEFNRVSERTPTLADLKPGGRFVATDLYQAGGAPLVAKRLLDAGLFHGDAMTVTGRKASEEPANVKETAGQE